MRVLTDGEKSDQGLTPKSDSGTCRSPFAQAVKGARFFLLPGARMIAHYAHELALDNATDVGKAAGACDTSRSTQRARKETLEDLQRQQIKKAQNLQSQLKSDAECRRNVTMDTPFTSAHGLQRLAADSAVAGSVVAKRKHRGRRHAGKLAGAMGKQLAQERFHREHECFDIVIRATNLSGRETKLEFGSTAIFHELRCMIGESFRIPVSELKLVFQGFPLVSSPRTPISSLLGATYDGEEFSITAVRRSDEDDDADNAEEELDRTEICQPLSGEFCNAGQSRRSKRCTSLPAAASINENGRRRHRPSLQLQPHHCPFQQRRHKLPGQKLALHQCSFGARPALHPATSWSGVPSVIPQCHIAARLWQQRTLPPTR